MPRSVSTVSVPSRTIGAAQKNAATQSDSLVWRGEINANNNATTPKIYTITDAIRSPEGFVKFFAMSEHYADSIGKTPRKALNKMQAAIGKSLRNGADDAPAAIAAYTEAVNRFIENARFIDALRKRVPHLNRVRLAGCDLAAYYATAEQVFRTFGYISAEKIDESRNMVKASVNRAVENDKAGANKR